VRHSRLDASDVIGNSAVANGPHLMKQADFRAGWPADGARPLARRVGIHPQLATRSTGARLPAANIMWATWGPLGYGPYAGKRDEVFATWKAGITELARCRTRHELGGMMMSGRYDYGTRRHRVLAELADTAPVIDSASSASARALHVESNFPSTRWDRVRPRSGTHSSASPRRASPRRSWRSSVHRETAYRLA